MRPLSDAYPSAAHAARALQMLGSHLSGTGTGTMEQKPLAPNDAILALDALAPDLPVSDAHLGARALQELCHGLAAKRSEEHTSELQSRGHLVCRLLLDHNKR